MDLSKMLINRKGLTERYSVSSALIGYWARTYRDFPKPLDVPMVIGIPIWNVQEVDVWIEAYRPYLDVFRVKNYQTCREG